MAHYRNGGHTVYEIIALQKNGEDSPELSEGIAALEEEARTKAAELEAKAKEVRAAIDSVEDILCRTLATLHYVNGLS